MNELLFSDLQHEEAPRPLAQLAPKCANTPH